MPTLYVTEPGAQVEKEYGKLLVTKDDHVLASAIASQVTSLVLVGNVDVTTPALYTLLEQGADVILIGRQGRLRGRLVGPLPRNVALRRQQYARMNDEPFCLALSRAIVAGKLQNYQTLIQRWTRKHPDLAQIGHARTVLADVAALTAAPTRASLMGLEGTGSKAYFAVLRALLQRAMPFERRLRRPPPDPVNALLSLAYTLLVENCVSALEIVGLDPYAGFFHAQAYGRPALALDLMEELRGVVADSVVVHVLNRRIITATDFEPGDDGGVVLKAAGLRRFFHHYAATLERQVMHPLAGHALSYRKIMEVQARQLRKVIEGRADVYTALRVR